MPKTKKLLQGKPKPSVIVPKYTNKGPIPTKDGDNPSSENASPSISPVLLTPKTPADEGIEFFQSESHPAESPIRVYELHLDPDGGPNTDRIVSDNLAQN